MPFVINAGDKLQYKDQNNTCSNKKQHQIKTWLNMGFKHTVMELTKIFCQQKLIYQLLSYIHKTEIIHDKRHLTSIFISEKIRAYALCKLCVYNSTCCRIGC